MAYMDTLQKEMKEKAIEYKEWCVDTVFIGGGTPTSVPYETIVRTMDTVKDVFSLCEDCEITMECNPGTVTKESLMAYRAAGINRLSIGLQSAEDDLLKKLGRIHTYDQFLQTFEWAREAGFTNVNVDLMSALPGQTVETWKETMEKVVALQPEHISAYSLIIEEGTPFYDLYDSHSELLPTEEDERQMYYDTKTFLASKGYERYEISNYAKPGYECRHNLSYWERIDYLGLGLGAASLLGNVRKSNQTELSEYLKGNFAGEEETLTETAAMEEYFFLGLRMMKGVDFTKYRSQYEGKVAQLIEEGVLSMNGNWLFLTDLGIDVSNYVLSQFLIE
jgi:oxygen-independent coproporphyrinogen-3 oxidase